MRISRRDALTGATAAAAVAAVPAVASADALPVADTSDTQIFALVEEYDRTFAEMHKARDLWCEVVVEKMPPHLQRVLPLGSKNPLSREAIRAAIQACEHPEVKVLQVPDNRLKERCDEIAVRLSQTEPMTLEGVCTKLRFATRGWLRKKGDIFWSIAADLERLAGEARS